MPEQPCVRGAAGQAVSLRGVPGRGQSKEKGERGERHFHGTAGQPEQLWRSENGTKELMESRADLPPR